MPETGIDRYDELHAGFRWQVPERFNIAEVCCTRWARKTPEAIAIRYQREDGSRRDYSYAELDRAADRLAAALLALGVAARRPGGDRHAAALRDRGGAHRAVPTGRGRDAAVDAVRPRRARVPHQRQRRRLALVDETGIDNVLEARPLCPHLATLVAVGGAEGRGDADWRRLLAAAGEAPKPVDTTADDACVLIYTSGTTGPPKGALLPHRVLIGNLPGFVCSQNWFPQDDARVSGRRRTGPGPAA